MGVRSRTAGLVFGCFLFPMASAAVPAELSGDYREPPPDVTALLTAARPPEFLVHPPSRRVALLYREPVIGMERLMRPRLGLAGFRYEPGSRTSGIEPLVTHVDVISADGSTKVTRTWRPADGALLEFVAYSPDGRWLSALAQSGGSSQLRLFDIERGRERVIEAGVHAGWGEPCRWAGNDGLLCRVTTANVAPEPAPFAAPMVISHEGEPDPVRTYANLLHNEWDDALFEHHFSVGFAHVGTDGSVRRVSGIDGLIEKFDVSPDGAYVAVTRVGKPYSRLRPARHFPSVVEIWDLGNGRRLYASGGDGNVEDDEARDRPTRMSWKSGTPVTLGYIESSDEDGGRVHHWIEFDAPFTGERREVVQSDRVIKRFGWTSAGTPWYATSSDEENGVTLHARVDGAMRAVWSGTTGNDYENPGQALRVDGASGPVLEANGVIFLAGDGESPGGPRPFLDAFDFKTGQTRRVFEAKAGEFERVLGVLDPARTTFVTARETEADAPRLFLHTPSGREALTKQENPYPQLDGVTREVLHFERADGIALSGTLYLPAGYRKGTRVPTLVWIYPYEFTDRAQAEQLDLRAFQYHRVKGPSPLAAVVAGYAVLMNPTVPIMYEGSTVNDAYLPQLASSLEAAVDHLVSLGVTDPSRVAVAGRSYGSFSSANLLIHTDLFATAICMSGAYNRTLTPYGFQHERRSFWDAGEMYANVSPFFHADKLTKPILLIHGGGDPNPGTPPMQARRFVHALLGQGATVRYVELPVEGHHYWARENVLLASAEMLDWLDKTIGSGRAPAP